MTFWLYMITVVLSLPKSIVFVILGTPSSEHSKGAKYGKVIAVLVLVVVTGMLSTTTPTPEAMAFLIEKCSFCQ